MIMLVKYNEKLIVLTITITKMLEMINKIKISLKITVKKLP